MVYFVLTQISKARFMGPVLIWPNITIVVNVVFWETSALTLTRVRHTVSRKRVIVNTNIR